MGAVTSPRPTDDIRALARRYGYSPDLVARYALFFPDYEDLVASMEAPTPEVIRVNTLRATPAAVRERLEAKGFALEPLPFCADAFTVTQAPVSLGATTEYLLGQYFKQDAASLLPVLALAPRPGEHVIDMCAAPGGKTTHIAQCMGNKGILLALDNTSARMAALRANLSRCGVENAAVFCADAADSEALTQHGLGADAILLDAPCSCEGTIPSDPSRKQGTVDEFTRCAAQQQVLIQSAARLLKPGGRLVYSTCTFAPEENEWNVVYAVEKAGLKATDIAIDGIALDAALTAYGDAVLPAYVRGAKRVFPHRHGMHGFFIACFVKPG